MRNIFSFVLLLIVTCCALFALLIVDASPKVQVLSSEQVDKAESVNTLLYQLRAVIQERQDPQQVVISPAQAKSLAGFLQRARGQAQADVSFSEDQGELTISYSLGKLISELYINVEIRILSGQGLVISRVQIGSITIPGSWALKIIRYAVNQRTQKKKCFASIIPD